MPTRAEAALARAGCPSRVPVGQATPGGGLRASLAYEAFCRDHWPVYRVFGTAAAGCARIGADIARDALRDLACQWDLALQAAAPAALAWGLLSAKCDPHHKGAVRRLRNAIGPREVDALLLRHRIGLPAPDAAHAMGLDGPGFDLLCSRALRRITCLAPG
ncbi:hypothetical protein ACIP6I_02470 [Streptomyces anulatus]